jgi:hypothetical protein
MLENIFLLIITAFRVILVAIGIVILVFLASAAFFYIGVKIDFTWIALATLFLFLIFSGYRLYRKKYPPKDKYKEFLKNYKNNPASELTIESFCKISPFDANRFFEVVYSDYGDGFVMGLIKQEFFTPNTYIRADYLKILENRIHRIEDQYKRFQKNSFNVGSWEEGIDIYEQALLENYPEVCLLLQKKPIPELIEDFNYVLEKQREIKRETAKKRDEQRTQELLLLKKKRAFLEDLLRSTEGKNLHRDTIAELFVNSYRGEFYPNISYAPFGDRPLLKAYRLDGVWFFNDNGKKIKLKSK